MELEIGCSVGSLRPNYYLNLLIGHLLSDNELNTATKQIISSWKQQQPINKHFGDWTYELNTSKDLLEKEKVRNLIYNFLMDLYNDNCIRYGNIIYI